MTNNSKQNANSPQSETVTFGTHLTIDAYNCNPEKLDSYRFCIDLLDEMVKLASMTKILGPMMVKAEGNEVLGGKDPGGFSGFVIIQESHISLHTFVRRKYATIDLYSCREFDAKGVIDYVKEALETDDMDVIKLDRGLKYPKENLF